MSYTRAVRVNFGEERNVTAKNKPVKRRRAPSVLRCSSSCSVAARPDLSSASTGRRPLPTSSSCRSTVA